MNIQNASPRTRHSALMALLFRVSATLFGLIAGVAQAGDLTALNWEEGATSPTLQIWVTGSPSHDVQSLDGGQRLRVTLPGTTLQDVSDVEGRGDVKGVYPYLSETGTGVHIDFLLSQPGKLSIESATYGLRVVASTGAAPTDTAAKKPDEAPAEQPADRKADQAPAEKKTESAPVAATPAPAPAAVPTTPPPAPKPAPVAAKPAPVAAKPAANLSSIDEILYAKLPGDRVQITLRMKGGVPKPAVFSTTNPARLAFDFPNTKVGLGKSQVKIDQGSVTSINAIEAQNRTRIVVNLVRAAGYTTTSDGRSFSITVDNPTGGAGGVTAGEVTRFATATRAGKHSLKSIDFRRGPNGDGKIIVGLSDTGVGIDIREQAGEIIVDFLDTGIPAEMQRRLDVTDFGTPVRNIDTFIQGRHVRLVIAAKGKYEHLAYQAGEQFTVNVKPILKSDERKADEFGFTGEKLSLNFQNIDVRAALQVIADFTNLNFVTSDTVKGSLTLRLKDVPWDQALQIIADSKNLAIRKSGNVVRVGPADEVAAKEKAAFEASKAAIELEPLVSELIQVNYAKAEEMAKLLKSIKAVDPGSQQGSGSPFSSVSVQKLETESNSLLSPRGQVTVDVRTNTLLIQDIPSKIREVRKLVSQLDQPVRQVMIETRLVEATDDWAKNVGVRWGGFKRPTTTPDSTGAQVGDSRQVVFCGSSECQVDNINGDPVDLNESMVVNFGAAPIQGQVAGSLSIIKLFDSKILNLELSALEADGKGKIISSPRLITGNQKKARIEQGQEGLFRALGGVGATSFIIRKAVLALEVTPQITPDDRIIMDVLVTKDIFADSVNGLIDKKEITTQVLLDNGETVVIGGIFEQQESRRVNKVPFFGDVPVIGWAFRKTESFDRKRELLIFLTPRILSERLSLR